MSSGQHNESGRGEEEVVAMTVAAMSGGRQCNEIRRRGSG